MSKNIEYKSGDVYGNLMLTGKSYIKFYGGSNRRFIEVICNCGTTYFTYYSPVFSGVVVSCGCKKNKDLSDRTTVHGMAARGAIHTLYTTWQGMKLRCLKPNNISSLNYYDKGIAICKEWLNFVNFKNWALSNGWEKGLQLDRINIDGNYEPVNCRWSTMYVQSRNKRTNRFITAFGETKCFRDWVLDKRCMVTHCALHYRLVTKGWDAELAISTPPFGKNK